MFNNLSYSFDQLILSSSSFSVSYLPICQRSVQLLFPVHSYFGELLSSVFRFGDLLSFFSSNFIYMTLFSICSAIVPNSVPYAIFPFRPFQHSLFSPALCHHLRTLCFNAAVAYSHVFPMHSLFSISHSSISTIFSCASPYAIFPLLSAPIFSSSLSNLISPLCAQSYPLRFLRLYSALLPTASYSNLISFRNTLSYLSALSSFFSISFFSSTAHVLSYLLFPSAISNSVFALPIGAPSFSNLISAASPYSNFYMTLFSSYLVLPLYSTISFYVLSFDVIHSFGYHSFGFKSDAIPGRVNSVAALSLFVPGFYSSYCYELCGSSHTSMLSSTIVLG
jgi:hypothetical protein